MTAPPARLCFVGHMLGRNPGYVTSQGEFVADALEAAGHSVLCVSAAVSRWRRLREIVQALVRQRRDLDVLVLNVFSGQSFVVTDVASRLGRRFGHRLVMWLHGGGLPEFIDRYPRWATTVLRRADAIVAPSPFLAHAVRERGFEARIIPNSINLSDYPYRQRPAVEPRLFWMRSFHPLYNPEMAVRTLAHLRQTLPHAHLVMAGQDKGLEDDTKRLAKRLDVDDAVRFAGFLDQAGKGREGNAADIYLNTNRVDNSPVSVVEACAMGLPVVATAVGGIPYLVADGHDALLVPDGDHEAMAAAIERLVCDPELARRLGARGRALAQTADWMHVRPHWETLIAELQ